MVPRTLSALVLALAVSCAPAPATDPSLALSTYRSALADEAGRLVEIDASLGSALKSGDQGRARDLYGPARAALGHLAPALRLVPGVLESTNQALHTREAGAWGTGTPPVGTPAPDLRVALASVPLTQAALVKSASEFLATLRTGPLLGLSEPLSKTDLWDLEAGLQGAEWVWQAFSSPVRASDPALGRELDAQFSLLYGQISTLRHNDVLRPFTDVYPAERTGLDGGIAVLQGLWARFASRP